MHAFLVRWHGFPPDEHSSFIYAPLPKHHVSATGRRIVSFLEWYVRLKEADIELAELSMARAIALAQEWELSMDDFGTFMEIAALRAQEEPVEEAWQAFPDPNLGD